jgi:hypothetical protein
MQIHTLQNFHVQQQSFDEISVDIISAEITQTSGKKKTKMELQKHFTCYYSPQKEPSKTPSFPSSIIPQNNPSHFT